MDERDVILLAQYENGRWVSSPETHLPFDVSDRVETRPSTDDPGMEDSGQWRAYWPLGSTAPVAAEASRMANFQFIEAAPVGRVLIVRFTWLLDPDQREFLLPWDLSQSAEKDLAVASSLLFERILRLIDSPDWLHRNTVAISSRISLIIPSGENR